MLDPSIPSGAESPGEKEPHKAGRRGASVFLWSCLLLLAILTALQVAGVLLRDRLEGRLPVAAQAPEDSTEETPATPAEPGSPTRFGPEVREVDVAPTSSAPAVEVAPSSPPPPPAEVPAVPAPTGGAVPAAPGPAPRAGSQGDPARDAVPPKARAGTHALEVDTFLSQRYLREMEERLSKAGLPSFRKELTRRGDGQRLTVSVPDHDSRQRALEVLEAERYAFRQGRGAFEIYFYYPEEAAAASAAFSRRALEATLSAVDGSRPIWKLYAGPFSREEARKAQEELSSQGIRSLLGTRP